VRSQEEDPSQERKSIVTIGARRVIIKGNAGNLRKEKRKKMVKKNRVIKISLLLLLMEILFSRIVKNHVFVSLVKILIGQWKLDEEGYNNHFGNGQWKLTKGFRVIAREKRCCTLYKTQAHLCKGEVNTMDSDSFIDL